MDINEVKVTLSNGTIRDKIELVSYLNDVFESYNKNIVGINEIVQILIYYVVNSDNDELTDELLETICAAQINQNIDIVDFSKIAEHIDKVSERFLSRYIDILSYTHDRKYLSDILRFKNHSNIYVKQAVNDAIAEMGGLS